MVDEVGRDEVVDAVELVVLHGVEEGEDRRAVVDGRASVRGAEVLDRGDGLPRMRDELHVPHRRRPRDRHRRDEFGDAVEVGHLRRVDVQQRRTERPQRGLGVPLQHLLRDGRGDVLRHPVDRRELCSEQRGVVGGQVALLHEATEGVAPRGRAQRGEQRLDAREHLLAEQDRAVERDDGRGEIGTSRGELDGHSTPRAVADQHRLTDPEPVAQRGDVRRLGRDGQTLARGGGVRHRAFAVARRVEGDHPIGRRERRGERPQIGPRREPAVDEHGGRPVAAGVVVGESQTGPLDVVCHDPPTLIR